LRGRLNILIIRTNQFSIKGLSYRHGGGMDREHVLLGVK